MITEATVTKPKIIVSSQYMVIPPAVMYAFILITWRGEKADLDQVIEEGESYLSRKLIPVNFHRLKDF